jgi:NAD(P)-dependent dehydrogenase (short-subunit alcohol dehydrogenase family)
MLRSVAGSRGWDSEEEFVRELGEEVPLGRLGTTDEIGDLAVFLVSAASKYITGTEIVIDGGNVIQEHKS